MTTASPPDQNEPIWIGPVKAKDAPDTAVVFIEVDEHTPAVDPESQVWIRCQPVGPERLVISAAVSKFDRSPFVNLAWMGAEAAVSPLIARNLAIELLAAAESAETDALVLSALTRHGFQMNEALTVIAVMREERAVQAAGEPPNQDPAPGLILPS